MTDFESSERLYECQRKKLAGRNDSIVRKFVRDPKFGLVPDKPVFMDGIGETSRFLEKLTTSDGTKVYAVRDNVASRISGIAGLVDCYVMFYKKKGIFFKKDIRIGRIYICEYSNKTVWRAPRGYSLDFNPD